MTTKMRFSKSIGFVFTAICLAAADLRADTAATITVHGDVPGTKISSDLVGIFFEDINYAADGGLYAELVQNRSFEYSVADGNGWNALTGWELVQRGAAKGSLTVQTAEPLNENNLHHAVLNVEQAGDGVGLANSGFDGISLRKGDQYEVSFFARQTSGARVPFHVRLESKTGSILGEARVAAVGKNWAKCSASIAAIDDAADASLVLLADGPGTFCFDTVSLFPQNTFHNHPNGLRADLAQVIADLHPKFVRFPGGCLVHGYGLSNLYRWKDTIGPVEQRREQRNIWHYHQSVGLGYFEYFQFCEDIGAKPLPIQAAGVCCQNSPGGQHGLPMNQMQDYVQDVLDLIEYANGPANSTWGAKRAAAGHPAPFHLQYVGVGNEDAQTPEFGVRFKMIYDAVKAKHPEITVVGTVGPSPDGSDFTEGWKFARSLGVDMVDEHYYEGPDWFLQHVHRYDGYQRSEPKVYVGEYASWGNTLFNALSEAAYLTGLERNGDVVRMASYAPLLGRENHMQWRPNLIYFNNRTVCPSVNYYVQQLFSQNQGDVYFSTEISSPQPGLHRNGFMLGAWDTQVQFKDVKVESGKKALIDETFQAPAENWTPLSGQWQCQNGIYSQSGDGQPTLSFLKTKIDRPNYTLSLKAKKTGGKEGFLIGFAVDDPKNFYWWNIGGWDNTQHAIEETVNGSKTTLGEPVAGSIETNRWYDIKMTVADGRIQCYLDGVKIHDLMQEQVAQPARITASCVKDSKTGDVIVKLVNVSAEPVHGEIHLAGLGKINPIGRQTVLSGNAKAEDTFQNPATVIPVSSELKVGESFTADLPANSLAVIRMKTL